MTESQLPHFDPNRDVDLMKLLPGSPDEGPWWCSRCRAEKTFPHRWCGIEGCECDECYQPDMAMIFRERVRRWPGRDPVKLWLVQSDNGMYEAPSLVDICATKELADTQRQYDYLPSQEFELTEETPTAGPGSDGSPTPVPGRS